MSKNSHLKLICFVSVSSVLFVPPMHLVVMQVVLWNASDFFSIVSVIFVSDAPCGKSGPSLSKNIAFIMPKSLMFCCVLQCFVNLNILPQDTQKSSNPNLELSPPPTPPPAKPTGEKLKAIFIAFRHLEPLPPVSPKIAINWLIPISSEYGPLGSFLEAMNTPQLRVNHTT